MGTATVPPDDALEVELAALRARAYGADSDITGDPDALGRLAELEEWHAAWVNSVTDDREPAPGVVAPTNVASWTKDSTYTALRLPSRLRALSTSHAGYFGLGAAAMAAVVLLGAVLLTWGAPRADTTLTAVDAEPEPYVFPLVDRARELLIDKSTLRTYEPYRDVELWSAESALGNRCLLALERSSDRLLAAGCVPPGADPTIEIYDVPIHARDRWHVGLPTGSVARFTLSDDVVSVWLYLGVPPD
jgi:hypothetical protein